jgi:ribosomal protein S27AE
MQCPRCGGPMSQNGAGWSCYNCGTQRTMTMEPGEISEIDCPRCGCLVAGVNGRYACTACEWVSPPNDRVLVTA